MEVRKRISAAYKAFAGQRAYPGLTAPVDCSRLPGGIMDGASTMFADCETASRQCGWAFFMARAFSVLSFLLGSSSFAEITVHRGHPLFMDVEGMPGRNFYYIVGLRYAINGEQVVPHRQGPARAH